MQALVKMIGLEHRQFKGAFSPGYPYLISLLQDEHGGTIGNE
jgi:hypothetical protein